MTTTISTLQPVTNHGPLRGFGNLFGNEMKLWWGTRKWLIHLLVWVLPINALIALVASQSVGSPLDILIEVQEVFIALATIGSAIGVITGVQGSVIREKQLGTAAWLLSKPMARPAFILAKLAAQTISFLVLAILIPALVFVGQMIWLWHAPFAWGPFLAGLSVSTLHLLFYLTLVILLGTVFNERGPVAGVSLTIMLGGLVLTQFIPMALLSPTPILLAQAATTLASGQPLPQPLATIAIVATAIWSVVFVGLALWRFSREEF
jgi:ABC-2 type transport system permease protein